jgi:hypothetical protein
LDRDTLAVGMGQELEGEGGVGGVGVVWVLPDTTPLDGLGPALVVLNQQVPEAQVKYMHPLPLQVVLAHCAQQSLGPDPGA